eukprot:scaffold82313_cov39-Cyclotella_meneghiniana.AAC.7
MACCTRRRVCSDQPLPHLYFPSLAVAVHLLVEGLALARFFGYCKTGGHQDGTGDERRFGYEHLLAFAGAVARTDVLLFVTTGEKSIEELQYFLICISFMSAQTADVKDLSKDKSSENAARVR